MWDLLRRALRSASPIFSWSAVLLGSMAMDMTGSGKEMFSRTMSLLSHSVSPVNVSLKPKRRPDIAGADLRDVLATIGIHADQAADALALPLRGVHHHLTLADDARVDAEVGQPPDIRVSHDLEDQGAQRRIVPGRQLDRLLVAAGLGAPNGGDVRRRRQVIDDRVQQDLHALVLAATSRRRPGRPCWPGQPGAAPAFSSSTLISAPSR